MIVYVDVLLALNFMVDYLLLVLSARLCGARVLRGRCVLAALGGALGALLIFLPPLPGAVNLALKLGLTAALAAVAGGYASARGYLGRLLALLVASAAFAGVMLGVSVLSGGKTGFYYNGACYFNISGVGLLGCCALAYALITLYQRVFKKAMAAGQEYTALITAGGRTMRVQAVMDSQNSLIDLFTGTPVVIGSVKTLGGVLPPGVALAAAGGTPNAGDGVRLIPCATVAGQDVLPAFRPERFVLECAGEAREIGDVYIAAAASLSGAGSDKLILNPALTGRTLLPK